MFTTGKEIIMKLTANENIFRIQGQNIGTITGDIFFLSAGISFAFFILVSIMGNMTVGIMFAPAFALITFSLVRFVLLYESYFKADKKSGKLTWCRNFGKTRHNREFAEVKVVRNEKYLKKSKISGYKNLNMVVYRTLLVDACGEHYPVAEDIDREKIKDVSRRLSEFMNIPVEDLIIENS
jgi:hypothetical protein